MARHMKRMTKPALALAAAAAAALIVPAAPAAADTVVATVPSSARPQDISTYGGTYAWSQRAADGGWRLVVKTGSAAPALAPIAPFGSSVDPDVGPRDASGAPVVVYSRCATAARCDVYRFDPSNGKEAKLAGVSKGASAERAPSTFKGAVLFARSGGGARGAYLYRPGKGTRRLDSKVPVASDLGDGYAAMLVRAGSSSYMRFSTWNGTARTIARDTSGDAGGSVYGPPSITRYYVYWRASDPIAEHSSIYRVGIRRYAGRFQLQRAGRTLAPGLELAAAQRPSGSFTWLDPDPSLGVSAGVTSVVTSDPPITFG